MSLLGAILMGIFVPLMAIAFCVVLPLALWKLMEYLDEEGLI